MSINSNVLLQKRFILHLGTVITTSFTTFFLPLTVIASGVVVNEFNSLKTSNFGLPSTQLIVQFNDPSLVPNTRRSMWYCARTNGDWMYFEFRHSPDVHVSYNRRNPALTHLTMGQYNARRSSETRFYYYPLGNGGNGSFNNAALRSPDVQRGLTTTWVNFRNNVLSPSSVPPPSLCRKRKRERDEL
jgi:hypothetical protein